MDSLRCIRLETGAEQGPLVEEFVGAADLDRAVTSHTRPDEGRCELRIWLGAADGTGEQVRAKLAGFLAGTLPPEIFAALHVTLDSVDREDWSETWKRHFHVQRVSRRIVVKPSWEAYEAAPSDIVLDLDPGMSFGTGRHETTRACLEYLDELSDEMPGAAMLDAGCGSGILSLAALQLGFAPVAAFDHDPQAVLVARETLTGWPDEAIRIEQVDLDAFAAGRRFPLVVANILAVVLLDHATTIASLPDNSPDARLILSGILDAKYPDIVTRFAQEGLQEESQKTLGEWTTGCFRR